MISILLVDDHTLMRQGLREILSHHPEFEVVGEAGSGLEGVELAARFRPDVAVVDIAMKELNGIEATAQILKRSPRTSVLILSMYSDERYVTRAFKAGAKGYVLKNSAGDELVAAIRSVLRGEPFFGAGVSPVSRDRSTGLADASQPEDRYELLTERERQVFQLLAEGQSNKEIANRLGLSPHTVETHRARIMEKMDVHSMADLVLGAVRRGIVS